MLATDLDGGEPWLVWVSQRGQIRLLEVGERLLDKPVLSLDTAIELFRTLEPTGARDGSEIQQAVSSARSRAPLSPRVVEDMAD
jgi:hypothetical protein